MKRLIKRLLMILQVLLKRDTSPKIFFYHDIGTRYTPMGTPEDLFGKHVALLASSGLSESPGGRISDRAAGDQRACAEQKICQWLTDVDEKSFESALLKLVEEKVATGEYVFSTDAQKDDAITWAMKFFALFSRKLIALSDGRYVYFVPDYRARARGIGNAQAWAEYSFHAVSTGGKQVPGKSYFVRHYSEVKCENLALIESTIREERCVPVIERDRPERDAVHFVGTSTRGRRFDIVTRLDEYGNIDANLSEVTVVMTKKKYSEKCPPPEYRPLTEAVEAVAKHQAAGFSPSTTGNSIANRGLPRKGGENGERIRRSERHRICFDDGFRGIWDVRDKLHEKGIRPTVFVAIRLVGQPGYLTWDEIRTLQNDYGFEFQCHTWSHQTLAGGMIDESPMEDRTEAWFRRELIESKTELARQLGRAVTALCLPAGMFSDEVIRRCREAGYEKVYASFPGVVSDDYVQPRNLVQDFSPFDFKLALKGGLMVFRRRLHSMHHVAV